MTQGSSDQIMTTHPVDDLIIDLVSSHRQPTQDEKRQIIMRVSVAPFRPERIRFDPATWSIIEGQTLQSHTFNRRREDSILAHWGKRILVDHEWSADVTPHGYETDLRLAVTHTTAIHFGHSLTQGIQVGTLADNFLPMIRTGRGRKPYIYVVYSATHGCLLTGYQTTASNINHGGDLIWL